MIDPQTYLDWGWHIFPCHSVVREACTCSMKELCENKGKHPRTPNGVKDAANNPQLVADWLRRWGAENINWAVACGVKSDLVVIDIDLKKNGFDALEAYESRRAEGPLPPTRKSSTGGGGRHLFYRYPAGGAIANKVGTWLPGIDIRSDNGYVILPPGSHAMGTRYLWVDPAVPLAQLPADVARSIRSSSGLKPGGNLPKTEDILKGIPEGRRDDVLFRACCRWRRQLGDNSRSAVETLALAAARACSPPFPDHLALKCVDSAFKQDHSTTTGDFGGQRQLVLKPASAFKIERVHWLWEGRIAQGTLSLLAGREGLGKSTLAYWIAARLSKGELPGEFYGTPKSVLVCATEDSWEHTISPRLIAAGADLDRVYYIAIETVDEIMIGLSLPRDVHRLEEAAQQTDSVLLLLDPLMSRVDGKLDTHRDSEVRQALEPMVAAAEKAGLAILGLMHHNKSTSSDPMQLVMGSRAFTAVARSVHTVVPDPDDDTGERKLFGTPKNNLGRTNLPVLGFTLESYGVETEDDGTAYTAQLVWGADSELTIDQALHRRLAESNGQASGGTRTTQAGEWLREYLEAHDSRADVKDIKLAAQEAGHAWSTVQLARTKQAIYIDREGSRGRTVSYWVLSPPAPEA